MPTLNFETYIIDFLILESNDPKNLAIFDTSVYLDTPEKPKLEITMPGYTGSIEMDYTIGGLTIINSNTLGLTNSEDQSETATLNDGIYIIKQKVCPYDELFKIKYYLRTTDLQDNYERLLLKLDDCTFNINKLKNDIIDIEILIQSAKAEIKYGNLEKAVIKYTTASKKIDSVNKKIDC